MPALLPLVSRSPDPRIAPSAQTSPPRDARPAAWRALVRFHAGAGARAALRAGTIGVAVLLFTVGSAPDPAYTLLTAVRSVVGREAGRGPGPPGGRVVYAILAASLCALGARRVALGAMGWLRSLPVSARTARRARRRQAPAR